LGLATNKLFNNGTKEDSIGGVNGRGVGVGVTVGVGLGVGLGVGVNVGVGVGVLVGVGDGVDDGVGVGVGGTGVGVTGDHTLGHKSNGNSADLVKNKYVLPLLMVVKLLKGKPFVQLIGLTPSALIPITLSSLLLKEEVSRTIGVAPPYCAICICLVNLTPVSAVSASLYRLYGRGSDALLKTKYP